MQQTVDGQWELQQQEKLWLQQSIHGVQEHQGHPQEGLIENKQKAIDAVHWHVEELLKEQQVQQSKQSHQAWTCQQVKGATRQQHTLPASHLQTGATGGHQIVVPNVCGAMDSSITQGVNVNPVGTVPRAEGLLMTTSATSTTATASRGSSTTWTKWEEEQHYRAMLAHSYAPEMAAAPHLMAPPQLAARRPPSATVTSTTQSMHTTQATQATQSTPPTQATQATQSMQATQATQAKEATQATQATQLWNRPLLPPYRILSAPTPVVAGQPSPSQLRSPRPHTYPVSYPMSTQQAALMPSILSSGIRPGTYPPPLPLQPDVQQTLSMQHYLNAWGASQTMLTPPPTPPILNQQLFPQLYKMPPPSFLPQTAGAIGPDGHPLQPFLPPPAAMPHQPPEPHADMVRQVKKNHKEKFAKEVATAKAKLLAIGVDPCAMSLSKAYQALLSRSVCACVECTYIECVGEDMWKRAGNKMTEEIKKQRARVLLSKRKAEKENFSAEEWEKLEGKEKRKREEIGCKLCKREFATREKLIYHMSYDHH